MAVVMAQPGRPQPAPLDGQRAARATGAARVGPQRPWHPQRLGQRPLRIQPPQAPKRQPVKPPQGPKEPQIDPHVLPQEAQRLRMFKALLTRYKVEGRLPEELSKFQDHLGFSMQDFLRIGDSRALSRMLGYSEARLEAKLAFFYEEFGFTTEEMRRLLLRFPRLFEYSLENKIVPAVEFFEDLGLSQKQVTQLMRKKPQVLLCHDLEGTLQPRVERLAEILGKRPPSSPKAAKPGDDGIQTDSPLASSSWEGNLLDGAEEPREISDLAKCILRWPAYLTWTVEHVDERVQFLMELGLTEEDVATVFSRHPQVVGYSTSKIQAVVNCLSEFNVNELVRVIVTAPQVLGLSISKNLEPKLAYLEDSIGIEAAEYPRLPQYLQLSLEKRIKPRHIHMKALGLALKPSHLSYTNEQFEQLLDRLTSSPDSPESETLRRWQAIYRHEG